MKKTKSLKGKDVNLTSGELPLSERPYATETTQKLTGSASVVSGFNNGTFSPWIY